MTTDNHTPAVDPSTLSDSDLSALFAVEVAGWKSVQHGAVEEALTDSRTIVVYEGLVGLPRCETNRKLVPPYATSFDAVSTWLEKWPYGFSIFYYSGAPKEYIAVLNRPTHGGSQSACAPTAARAACIALIRAGRAGKG